MIIVRTNTQLHIIEFRTKKSFLRYRDRPQSKKSRFFPAFKSVV